MVFCDGPDYPRDNRKKEAETIYREQILPMISHGNYEGANKVISENSEVMDCLDESELKILYTNALIQIIKNEERKGLGGFLR